MSTLLILSQQRAQQQQQEQQIETTVHWQLENYAYYKNCGEITISEDVQYFGFNCRFCDCICLQFDVFMQHIREQHGQDIKLLYESDDYRQQEQATQTIEHTLSNCDNDDDDNVDFDDDKLHMIVGSSTITTTTNVDDVVVDNNGANVKRKAETFTVDEINQMSIELEMQTDAPCEEVGLVYIMDDDNSVLQADMEEETVDDVSFQLFNSTTTTKARELCDFDYNRNEAVDYVEEESPSTAFEVEYNREIISCLLKAYKHNEKLWNPEHSEYKYNAKRSIFNELAEPLARDMNCTLSGHKIYAILRRLRNRYRCELTKLKESPASYKCKLWYFDKIDFLRDVIESKRAVKVSKSRLKSTESEKSMDTNSDATSTSTNNHEVLSYILNAFKRAEALWNPKHCDYAYCNKDELLNEIAYQLSEDLNVAMSGADCLTEIQKLRTRYRKELSLLHRHKGLYIPKLWCFDEMEFLRNVYEEQIIKRLDKRKSITDLNNAKSNFLKADALTFEDSTEQLNFIEIYRNYSELWDVDHPDFRSQTYRNKALNQMLEEVNLTFNLNANLEHLEKTIFEMRKQYSMEKQKQLTRALKGKPNVNGTPSYSKLAEFLDANVGPFRCDVCNMIIRTSDQYKLHKSRHDGTSPFICTLCGKGFQISGNLTVHIRRHKQDFPYACKRCDKRFATSTEVAIHTRTHTNERPYICDLCGKTFKTWSFFDIHRRTHLNDSQFHCPICDKNYYEKNRYTDHMNGHLNIRKHLCNVCGKRFTTMSNLKKHNELHLPEKKYKCTLCFKRFAQFASLRWHKKRAHRNYLIEEQ